MALVVGLGNPGAKYERTRHNIGFLAVDDVARAYNASTWSKKFRGAWCEARSDATTHFFLKPLTYMNLSGESVGAATHFYKIPPEDVIVVHDDLDLLPGKLRVKQGGGHGGHNGLKSLDAHIGQNYWRVRIGIGRPIDKDRVTDYVLENFGKEEMVLQLTLISAITNHFRLLMQGDAAGFMNKVALTA